jgi:predicted transcriptional regulator
MARPNSEYPTELELQILKVLWDAEPMTVREVREALAVGGRDLAHTTVITMLGTMVDKGQIEKLEPTQGKAFRFSPLIQRDEVSCGMLGDLVDVKELDEDELANLRKLLNKKMREARS